MSELIVWFSIKTLVEDPKVFGKVRAYTITET